MHESESGVNHRYDPETSQPSEVVCRSLNQLLLTMNSARSYDSLLMAVNTYLEEEYVVHDASVDLLYLDVMSNPQFPSEETYDADREAANRQALIVLYEYLGRLYEDSHSHQETNLWMIRLFTEIRRKTKLDLADEALAYPPVQDEVVQSIEFAVSTFSEAVAHDDYALVDEAYIKIKRRMRLAHVDGLLTDTEARSLYTRIDSAFYDLAPYGIDMSLVRSRVIDTVTQKHATPS